MTPDSLFLAALSAYARGSNQAAKAYCERALARPALEGRLTVRLIHLLLTATELWWDEPEADALISTAEAAATKADDAELRALAGCLRGRYLVMTDGLPASVAVLTEAAEQAEASGKSLPRVETLNYLGHYTVGLNMARGRALLAHAQRIVDAEGSRDMPATDRPLFLVAAAQLAGFIGVAAFDDGHYEEAERWMRRSLAELGDRNARAHIAAISNYLGQLLTTSGRFEEAEALLLTTLDRLSGDADLSRHQAYNFSLLGKLYLEWGRIEAAEPCLNAGWERLSRAHHEALQPIMRNYLGELFMHPANPRRDPLQARRLFDETVQECARTGFLRSEVAALAFRALADLEMGNREAARTTSTTAVRTLERAGNLPALRSEEVYLTHYRVLRGTGENAAPYLERARAILMAKAKTIRSTKWHNQFLTRVPVSRMIIALDSNTPEDPSGPRGGDGI